MPAKSKTITYGQITGEHGVALVKDRVHALGFLFMPYGLVEAGIDALIEIRHIPSDLVVDQWDSSVEVSQVLDVPSGRSA